MHEYSVKGHPRERYVFWIAVLAALAISAVREFGTLTGVTITVTTSAIFALLYLAWDLFLWKFRGLNRLYKLPDLASTWSCTGRSVGANGQTYEWEGDFVIEQTWSKISISVNTQTSQSRSSIATIESDAGNGYRLIYGYQNRPSSENSELRPHRGHCELLFDLELATATGVYFNDSQRKTWGNIQLERKGTEN